jgi:membrane protein DedA with SNARE-associated domain
MQSWSDLFLSALVTYGPWALALALVSSGAGIPIPGTLLLVAAGAFARQEMIDWRWAFGGGLLGVIIGDNIAYGMGRLGGAWAEARFGENGQWQAAVEQFDRRGGITIFLSRWLITPIGAAVSVIAGLSRFGWPRFLLIGAAGEFLWVLIYWMIGWSLSSQWQLAATFLTDFSGLLLGISLLLVAVVVGVRWLLLSRRTRATAPATAARALPESVAAAAVSQADEVPT